MSMPLSCNGTSKKSRRRAKVLLRYQRRLREAKKYNYDGDNNRKLRREMMYQRDTTFQKHTIEVRVIPKRRKLMKTVPRIDKCLRFLLPVADDWKTTIKGTFF